MRKVIVREMSYRGESGTLSLCVIYCKVRGAYSTQWRYIGSVHMYHNMYHICQTKKNQPLQFV